MPSTGRIACAAIMALTFAGFARPGVAAPRWEPIGVAENGDKSFVDLNSVKLTNGVRIATLMWIYPEPRVNDHGVTIEKITKVIAFNCGASQAVAIRSFGFLSDKQVGTSPEVVNWRDKMKPIGPDAISQKSESLVCNAILSGDTPQPGAPTTPGPIPGAAPPPPAIATGSGIFINEEGFVLTNAHVANGCKSIMVKALGGDLQSGKLDAVDPKNDLALIKTARGSGTPAVFRNQTHPARIGESIGVIGYPLTGLLSSEPKATFGQINSVAGINNDYTLLQISAPTQPGNSGGPVLDDNGLVVGIVVSQASPTFLAKFGIQPQNVNFAIRGEIAQIFMTAHGVQYRSSDLLRRLETADIAEEGEKSTAFIACRK